MNGLLAAVLLLGGAEAPQESLVKKVIPDAERIRKVSKRLDRDAQKKIERILGQKLTRGDAAPVVYQCWATVPSVSTAEKTRCRVVITSVNGPRGPIKLAVAVAIDDDVVHSVKILENKDDKALESPVFLKQFEGLEYAGSIENEASMLADALKEAKADKELAAILATNNAMRSMGPAWARMTDKIEKKDKSAAAEIDAMLKGLDAALKALPDLTVIRGSSRDRYKGYARDARTGLAKMKGLISGGKFTEAYRESGEVDSRGCATCHGSYRRRFRYGREGRDLGNGYFSTKVDVQVPKKNLEAAYQAVATGIRKAVLIASEL